MTESETGEDWLYDYAAGKYNGSRLAKFPVCYKTAYCQLKLIEAPIEMITIAASYIMSAEENVAMWILDGTIGNDDLDNFKRDLVRKFQQIRIIEWANCPSGDAVVVGRQIYWKCQEVARTMRISNVPEPLPNGTAEGILLMLSNEGIIGWHPDWEDVDLLKRTLEEDEAAWLKLKAAVESEDEALNFYEHKGLLKLGFLKALLGPVRESKKKILEEQVVDFKEKLLCLLDVGECALRTIVYWNGRNAGEVMEEDRPFEERYDLETDTGLFLRLNECFWRELTYLVPKDVKKALAPKVREFSEFCEVIVNTIKMHVRFDEKRYYLTLPPEWCAKGQDNRILLSAYAVKELLDVEAWNEKGMLLDQGMFKFKRGPDTSVYPGVGKRLSSETREALRLLFTTKDPNGVTDLSDFKNPIGTLSRDPHPSYPYTLVQHLQAVDEDGKPIKKRGRRAKKLYRLTCDIVRDGRGA